MKRFPRQVSGINDVIGGRGTFYEGQRDGNYREKGDRPQFARPDPPTRKSVATPMLSGTFFERISPFSASEGSYPASASPHALSRSPSPALISFYSVLEGPYSTSDGLYQFFVCLYRAVRGPLLLGPPVPEGPGPVSEGHRPISGGPRPISGSPRLVSGPWTGLRGPLDRSQRGPKQV